MLNLEPWADRLKDAAPCVVDIAADVDEALKSRAFPTVILVPMRERVAHAGLSGTTRHKVTAEVMLVTAVSRSHRRFAAESRDQLNALRKPLLTQLINWLPPEADIEVQWTGGELLNLNAQALFWVDVMTTEYWWTP
ncbi:hypothetical protein [Marinobacter sp.]|uniref:phage tail terminator protein n=1 Tax=Marinobacter sp. TaxID=50741 RepID=UPI0034A2B802